jgi:hypothetical protein
MPWPSLQEYNEAIQAPQICFEDVQLRSGRIECNQLGLPKARSGNFATVYKLESTGKAWAIKCFSRQMQDQQERYAAINAYLHQVSLPYMVDFTFLTRGIRVRGQWYPIVKMEWAHGETLDVWIRKNLHNTAALIAFSRAFVAMLTTMQQASIAHGDLQHGNILVVNSAPKLVDYDGMYVPALGGRMSNEVGQPNYQHPRRTAFDFGPYLDNFSGWVILISLVALSVDPKLWQTFRGGEDDCLLFRKRDFEQPDQSALVKTLGAEPNQELRQAIALFKTVIACSPHSVPTIDGDFRLQDVVSFPRMQTGGASWIQDHLPPKSGRPAPVRPSDSPTIDWLVDATHPVGAPVRFENGMGTPRAVAYLTLASLVLVVLVSLRLGMPVLLISVPPILGLNFWVLRVRYRREPAVPQSKSALLQRRGLQERLRVRQEQLAELDAEKQRINRRVSDVKADLAEEELKILGAEQKANDKNDAKLQSEISAALNNKQNLDGQELAELNALQNTLGKALASCTQSLGSLGQAEANELSNTLNAKQAVFVRDKLQKAWLVTAQIQGIGAGYKTRLQAAGIHTAADIGYRIQRVKGIGLQRAAALETWRNILERDARSKMPQVLSRQEEDGIKAKHATQKSTLELQMNQYQRELRSKEGSIRTKYATLRKPHEALVVAERQKHQTERDKITAQFRQERGSLAAKRTEAQEGAVRAVAELDSKQNGIRKEMFELQWQMGKAEREVGRFSRISFWSYVKQVLVFL